LKLSGSRHQLRCDLLFHILEISNQRIALVNLNCCYRLLCSILLK
jgi:hypothetical protein